MATIKFVVKGKKETAPIYVRLSDGRNSDIIVKTKFHINPNDWSQSKQQPKNLKDIDNKRLNEDLLDFKTDLLKHYNKSKGTVGINTKWLKEFINPVATLDDELPVTVIQCFDYYLETKKSVLSHNSIKTFKVVKGKVAEYEKEKNITVYPKDINLAFIKDFQKYCLKHGYSNNTITKCIRFIQTVLRYANKHGVEVSDKLELIETRYEKAENIYLTTEELKLIQDANIKQDYLDNARDWLLISCSTGQRISDFLRFTSDMIRTEKDSQGNEVRLIEFTQAKTGKRMALPLLPTVIKVLNKRNGEFPRSISDQKYNDYAKEVCRLAGISHKVKGSLKSLVMENDKPKLDAKGKKMFRKETGEFEKWELVSGHIGRRSLATNYFGKIPTAILMMFTGHTTESSFLKYIQKTQTDIIKDAAMWFMQK